MEVSFLNKPTEISFGIEDTPESNSLLYRRSEALAASLATVPEISLNAGSMAADQAKADFSLSVSDITYEEPNKDIEILTEKARKIAISKGWAGQYIPEERFIVNDPSFSPNLVRQIINRADAERMIDEKLKEYDESGRSWANKFFTSFDQILIRGILAGTYEGITRRTERQGREQVYAQRTKEPGIEFQEYFEEELRKAEAEGIFSGKSKEALERLLFETVNSGFDRYAGANQALSFVDAATVLYPAGRFVVRNYLPKASVSGSIDDVVPLSDAETVERGALAERKVLYGEYIGPDPKQPGPTIDAEFTEVPTPKRLTGPEPAPAPKQLTDQFADAIEGEFTDITGQKRLTGPSRPPADFIVDPDGVAVARSVRTNGVVSRVASVSDSEEAAQAYLRLKQSIGPDETAQAESIPAAYDPIAPLVTGTYRANASMVNRQLSENFLLREMDAYFKRDGINRIVPEEVQFELRRKIMDKARKDVDAPLIRVSEIQRDQLGLNPKVTLGFGNHDGSLMARDQAESLAAYIRDTQGKSAYAVPDNPMKPEGKWYTAVDMPIDESKGITGVDLSEPWQSTTSLAVRKWMAEIFGSSYQLDDLALTALANYSEGTRGKFRSLVQPMIKRIRKLPYKNRITINRVMQKLRDDPKLNYRTSWWSEFEFKTEYRMAHPDKTSATAADYDAYLSAVTVSDLVYTIRASKILEIHNRLGNKVIQISGDESVLARKAKDLNISTPVKDLSSGKIIAAKYVPEDLVIWEAFDPGRTKKYYIKPKEVAEPNYWDALDYNSGGPRFNPEANHFVVQWDGVNQTSGRAFLTAVTEKQASKALEELENIRAALKGRTLDQVSPSEIDSVIRKNNTFEPRITNLEHLKAWTDRYNIDWTLQFTKKKRGDKVEDLENVFDSLSYEDYYMATARRGQVLPKVGGGNTFSEDPISAIFRNFDSAAGEFSWYRYNQRSKLSWLKTRLGPDGLDANLKGKSVNQLFEEEYGKLPHGVTNNADRRLKEIGMIIKRRDFELSPRQEWLNTLLEYVHEFTFDKPIPTINIKNPVDTFMNLNFKTFFMFNPSQFFMQMAHASNVLAISPVHGARAFPIVAPLRAALHAPSMSVRKKFLKGLAEQLGVKENDVDELIQYIHDTQRTLVENDTIYRSTSMSTGFAKVDSSYHHSNFKNALYQSSKVGKLALDAGMVPFSEGEIISRLTGIVTAFLEIKAKNPTMSILTGEGKDMLSLREINIFGFSMNRANAGMLQQEGFRKIPMQFMSYPFRAMESVAFGRGLTKAQRIRLGVNLFLMGGITGAGFSGVANDIAEHFKVDPASPEMAFIQYGYFDAIATWAFQGATAEEIGTALGNRLSVIGAFVDIYKKISEGSFTEVLFGPSGTVSGGLASTSANVIESFFKIMRGSDTGSTEMLLQNLETLLRTPSGVDNLFKGTNILLNGKYYNKAGNPLPGKFSAAEGLLEGAGINTFARAYRQDFVEDQIENFRMVDDFVKKYKPMMAKVNSYYEQEDYANAKDLIDHVLAAADAEIGLPNLRNKAIKDLMEDPENNFYRSMIYGASPQMREYFLKRENIE
jgi:hypothetical protein